MEQLTAIFNAPEKNLKNKDGKEAAVKTAPVDTDYPDTVLDHIRSGKSPVTAWRIHRRMTDKQLADRFGTSVALLHEMVERDRMNDRTLKKFGEIFHCTLDRWSRREMLHRLAPEASTKERARIGQQIYQLERRSSRHSDLLLPIAELFGIPPQVLLKTDLTDLALSEVNRLALAEARSVNGGVKVFAGWYESATDEARTIVERVFEVDRDTPELLPGLSAIVNAFLDSHSVR